MSEAISAGIWSSGIMFGPSEGARDFVDNDTDPTDPGTADYTGNLASHGTHVTGIIAANWGQNTTATCAGCSPAHRMTGTIVDLTCGAAVSSSSVPTGRPRYPGATGCVTR